MPMLDTPPHHQATRFEELDSLRAIAALGVIAWHYTHGFHASPAASLLAPFYGRGLLMVDFFFVLSGFVLAKAFWVDRRSHQLGANVLARVSRMYPLHLAMLCAVAAMQWLLVSGLNSPPFVYTLNDGYHFVLHLLLLNESGLQHGFSFNAPSWSISTEFLVNLVFLALITLPRRAAAWSMAVVGAAAIGTMVSRGLINGTMAFGWVDNDLVRTAAGFFVGVLLERIHARLKAPGRAERLAWDAVAVGTAAVVMVYMASGSATNAADLGSCFVGFPLIITGVLRGQFVRSALQVRPLTYLGQISYSIYLVHFPVQLALHVASVGLSIPVSYGSVTVLGAYLLAVVVVASITYKTIEMPGKALLLGLRERRKISASNAAR